VLTGVSFELEGGAAVQLRGANGSGKTSLLRVLAGVAPPRAGRVQRSGACAFVPEKLVLAPSLRAGEWLAAMRRLRRLPAFDWFSAAQASGLAAEALERPSGSLSKGMLQRVALLEALHSEAGALLLDEPYAGLDAEAAGWLTELLTAHLRRGGAVLASDHSGTLAQRLGVRRALRLAEGRCEAAEPAAETAVTATAPDGTRLRRTVPVATLRDEGWELEP
jgi:ABC-type multidrug transport system ATPase subunit